MFDYLYLVIYRIPKAIFMALFCWSHFFYYGKCQNVKRYPFADVNFFDIWQACVWLSKLGENISIVYDRNHLFGLGSDTETETENWPKL